MIKTAIVILNWNGAAYLKKFLPSVTKNTLSQNNKIYIADNGSSDESCKYIRETWPQLSIIELGKNYGFAGGYNKALEKIEAEYYVLLNSDVEVSPGWLEALTEYMDSHSDIAACQPKILSYQDRNKFEHAGAAGGFIDKYGYPFCRGRILNHTEEDKAQYNDIRQIFWASGACLLIRSSIWKEFEGFDSDFFTHMEEIDLCWKINNSGKRIMYIPDSVVYHVGGGTLSYGSPAKVYYNFRNNLYMLYKNLPASSRRSIIFKRMILDGIAALVFLFSLKPDAFIGVLKAHFHFYRNKKSLRLKRTELENKKVCDTTELIMNKSIVYSFYIKKQKTYIDLIST